MTALHRCSNKPASRVFYNLQDGNLSGPYNFFNKAFLSTATIWFTSRDWGRRSREGELGSTALFTSEPYKMEVMKCCFTSTETVGLLGTGAKDGHLDSHTTPELCKNPPLVAGTWWPLVGQCRSLDVDGTRPLKRSNAKEKRKKLEKTQPREFARRTTAPSNWERIHN